MVGRLLVICRFARVFGLYEKAVPRGTAEVDSGDYGDAQIAAS